jgi:hypothetical protein
MPAIANMHNKTMPVIFAILAIVSPLVALLF